MDEIVINYDESRFPTTSYPIPSSSRMGVQLPMPAPGLPVVRRSCRFSNSTSMGAPRCPVQR